jgi:hypothetical protein
MPIPFRIVNDRRARNQRRRLFPSLDGDISRRSKRPSMNLRPVEQKAKRRIPRLNMRQLVRHRYDVEFCLISLWTQDDKCPAQCGVSICTIPFRLNISGEFLPPRYSRSDEIVFSLIIGDYPCEFVSLSRPYFFWRKTIDRVAS